MAKEGKSRFMPSRRAFVIGGLVAAGGLAVGIGWAVTPFSTLPRARQVAGREDESMLLTWLRIGQDDSVTVIVPHIDWGQGSQTALAMMLAEELDADWARVRVEEAPADSAFANSAQIRMFAHEIIFKDWHFADTAIYGLSTKVAQGIHMQLTAGSSAIRATGVHSMRPAGATARWLLRQAAAKTWGVPLDEIETRDSVLSHPASGRTARYGDMADAAARIKPPDPEDLPLKPKSAYRIVGKTQQRLDIPDKVDGSPIYPHDLRLPGMLYGAVRQCPVIDGKLVECDPAPAMAMSGVSKVVKSADSIIVVADNTWRARKAIAALEPQWNTDELDVARTSSARVREVMAAAVEGDDDYDTDHEAGDVDATLRAATNKLEAVYHVPYLSHAQMAPFATVAQFKDGHLTLWVTSQNPLDARYASAEYAQLPVEKVTLHNMKMGGGFGRVSKHDFILPAIDAAKANPGVPVQVSWTREEDMTHGRYRQASVAKLEGAVDESGRIVAFRHTYTDRHDMAEASAVPYGVENLHVRNINGLNPLRWGFWRSVDNSMHGFFIESFVDELAHAAGQDPLSFRLAQCNKRGRAVLERVAEISNWHEAPPAGRARGIMLKEAFGSIVAQVAEVSVNDSGRVRVHAVYTTIDPGLVINPGNLTAQIEGAVNFGLSATLYGAITFENGVVNEQNYTDYDMVRMADAPHQVVSFVESGESVGGGGEPGTPGVAPAVCNAIFALTGVRIRELPLRDFNLRTGERRGSA